MYKELTFAGWGRVKRGKAMAARPERVRDISGVLLGLEGRQLCSRGGGRSYGDCAINTGGNVLLTERLDRILSFDASMGVVAVEPGVTFHHLLEVFLPRGWLVPVSPGTGFVTVGGAVANDVHGKNHEHAGSFGQHIVELDVMTPDGALHTLTGEGNPAWFQATVGGLGLTGVITRIAFQMLRVPGSHVLATEKRIANLEAFFAAFETAKDATYSVGWIDALARGRFQGRGVLETAEPAAGNIRASRRRGTNVVMDFPNFALNSVTVAAFNAVVFNRLPANGRVRPRHYGDFFYPLDAVRNWNRIYGPRGFYQFQCVVPYADGLNAISVLLDEIARARAASFLAVLKRMGPGRAGYLSFPMEGYTLAVDFPNGAAVSGLYANLVRIVLDHGGRIYLAKDALLSSPGFERMYPELPKFREAIAQMDPQGRMTSDLATRLSLRQRS